MGYFSNGTEADLYEAEHCLNCVHYGDVESPTLCPVTELHWLWNYFQNQDEDKAIALRTFIPRDGVKNLKCRMFYPKEANIEET